MKIIHFNNPALPEILDENGINLICNENMDSNANTMEKLTINKAQELLDKTIEWSAPSAEGNAPYGGKAIITDIQANSRPLICTTIEGDNLNYAICEDDIHIDYSDYGRGVMYRVI